MKNALLKMSFIFGLLGLTSAVYAQGLIDSKQEVNREDLIRRPPFYVVPQFEMKNAFDEARANYLSQLPGLLKGLKTGADFSKNNVGNETTESLQQRLDDKSQWENLILDVKLACQVELNSNTCKKIFDLRESYNHKYRRQSAEDRKAEKTEREVQKKSEPAASSAK